MDRGTKDVGADAAGEAIGYALGEAGLGQVLVARGAKGVCAVLLGDGADALHRELRSRFPSAALRPAALASTIAEVVRCLETPGRPLAEPIDPRGTPFQRLVWNRLRAIPVGETATYAAIAASIGRPRSVRAVGAACGANPLAVLIPCHRAVRSDGGLAGYRWGIERKRRLLELERAATASA